MSATPSGPGGALPSRSQIEEWPTQHLDDAAAQLRSLGSQSVTLFERHRQNVAAPGGTTWEGDAKDAALDRVTADTAVVRRQSAVQDEAADLAENGGHDVRSAKRAALQAITDAEDAGFSVGEDLSVTDTRETDLDALAARQTAATEHADYIRFNAEQLVQADGLVGQRLQSKAVELEGIRFEGEGDGRETEGTVQLVDNTVKLNPPLEPNEDGKDPQDGKPDANPEGKRTEGVEGTLEDLLTPDEAPPGEPGDGEPTGLPPALSQQPPPSALDQILNQHTGNGKGGGQDPRYTRSPLTAPIVAADPSVLDRQAARVDAARQSLDAAQAEMDNAAGLDYTQGAGAGPGRDVTDPLSQAVFDARRELTTQTEILEDLNQAATETGAGTVPIPALPENADVQAFPPPLSIASQAAEGLSEASHDISESTFGLVPDVAHDIEVFSNWGEHSGADQAGAVLEAAGSVPIPGAKPLAEGIEHGLDVLTGASRHVDDIPTPHSDVPSAGQVDPPAGDLPHHSSGDTDLSGADVAADPPQLPDIVHPAELDIANTAHDIFASPAMDELRQAAQNGAAAEVEIGGYKVLYEPDLPGSGFSLASSGERGFVIGPDGMASDLELARTVAQEVYRVNMTQIPELGIDATRAADETQAAFDFAQKFGDTFLNGGG